MILYRTTTMSAIIENEYSVFIPSVRRELQEKDFAEMFCDWGIIDRVDFVEMTPSKAKWVKAFVHFERIYECDNMVCTIQYLENANACYIYDYTMGGLDGTNIDNYSMNVYKNHCPVAKTTLNIHQLATNLDILKETTEKSLEEANQKIAEQEDKIQDLRQQLYEQDRIVRLLMGQKDFDEK